MDGNNKDVDLDDVNAGDGEKNVDFADVYNGGSDSSDDAGVDDAGWINTNGGDDADSGNGDRKFDCGADSGSGDSDNKGYGGVDDNGEQL